MADTYGFSFSAIGPDPLESQTVARAWLETRDWGQVRRRIQEEDLLGRAGLATRRRVGNELIKRLRTLDEPQLEALATSSGDDRLALIWVAYCRAYPLFRDLAERALVPSFEASQGTFGRPQVDAFLREALPAHPELEGPLSLKRQQLPVRIGCALRGCGLTDTAGQITPLLPSPAVVATLTDRDASRLPGVRP